MCLKVLPSFHVEDADGDAISNSCCLKLLKNCYESRDVAANWCTVLSDSLEERSFKKSAIDPCSLIREDCMIFTHVDDCLTFYKKNEVLTELIESLKDDFKLTDESDLESFLGIQFKNIDKSTL